MKKVFLFCAIFCVAFSVHGQTFKYTGKFVSSQESLYLYSLLMGDFSITIDLNEALGLKGGSLVKIKISTFFSTKGPNSETQSFNFQGFSVETSDNIYISGNTENNEEAYGLRITPEGMRFGMANMNINGEKDVFQYLISKNDITGFDYNALVKAFKSKTSSSITTTLNTPTPQPPSGKIEKVWLEHNVYSDGEKGMNIHVNFNVNNMKGKICECTPYYNFTNAQGSYIMTAHKRFTPSYENAKYADFILFAPYKDFAWLINEKLPNSN